MRILHIGKYYPPFSGGIENFLADLIPAQWQQGQIVAALVHHHDSAGRALFSSVSPENFIDEFTQLSFPLYRAPSYGRVLYAPVSPTFLLWLNRVIQQWQPDVLHWHLPNTSAFWGLLSSPAKRLPWVIHWHSDVTSDIDRRLALAYRFYRPFEQAMLRRAEKIIATSPPYLKTSIGLQPWQFKTDVVSLGIAPQRLPMHNEEIQCWAESQWQPEKKRILHIGRLTYYKGQAVLIQAMQQVKNAQLLIVGKGEQYNLLQNLIKDLQLQDRVKLFGYGTQRQLIGLLASCDIFCLPSLERTEAFGVVLMEAMRYGKPVVASDIPGSGVGWVVQSGETGLLVPVNQISSFAQALQNLVDNPQKRQQWGEAGAHRFKTVFDIQQVAQQITNIYNKVLAGKIQK